MALISDLQTKGDNTFELKFVIIHISWEKQMHISATFLMIAITKTTKGMQNVVLNNSVLFVAGIMGLGTWDFVPELMKRKSGAD